MVKRRPNNEEMEGLKKAAGKGKRSWTTFVHQSQRQFRGGERKKKGYEKRIGIVRSDKAGG